MEVVTINGHRDVPSNDEASLLKALAHQPVSVGIEASGRDFQFTVGYDLLHSFSTQNSKSSIDNHGIGCSD